VAIGFRYTQDIMALICFIYGMLYFSIAAGYEGCKRQPVEENLEVITTYEDLDLLNHKPKYKSAQKEKSKGLTEKRNSFARSHNSFSGTPISIPRFNLSREYN
jgi:hypothetical protein